MWLITTYASTRRPDGRDRPVCKNCDLRTSRIEIRTLDERFVTSICAQCAGDLVVSLTVAVSSVKGPFAGAHNDREP